MFGLIWRFSGFGWTSSEALWHRSSCPNVFLWHHPSGSYHQQVRICSGLNIIVFFLSNSFRFSADFDKIDAQLPLSLRSVSNTFSIYVNFMSLWSKNKKSMNDLDNLTRPAAVVFPRCCFFTANYHHHHAVRHHRPHPSGLHLLPCTEVLQVCPPISIFFSNLLFGHYHAQQTHVTWGPASWLCHQITSLRPVHWDSHWRGNHPRIQGPGALHFRQQQQGRPQSSRILFDCSRQQMAWFSSSTSWWNKSAEWWVTHFAAVSPYSNVSVVFLTAIFAVFNRDHLSAGVVGIAIVYSLNFTSSRTSARITLRHWL